uniref:Uncharacterized protein n=1 Tax=Vitis vinifera TaxID=29760 RepID=F6H3L0_VITVI
MSPRSPKAYQVLAILENPTLKSPTRGSQGIHGHSLSFHCHLPSSLLFSSSVFLMLCERYTRLRSRRGQRRISFHSCKFTAAKEQMLGICQRRISRASNNTKIWAMLWIRPLPTSQSSGNLWPR